MNDFFWGDVDDQEIEAMHSDLLSIHDVIGRSCPSSSEQSFTAVLFHYDTDRTNNELDSVDGENEGPKNNLLEDFSETRTTCSKRSLDLKDGDEDIDDPDYVEEEEEEADVKLERRSQRQTRSKTTKKRKYQSADEKSSTSSSKHSSLADLTDLLAEQELHQLIMSPTDPVGKFLRKLNLSAKEAVKLDIHKQLLDCPRKIREKYGPRKDVDEIERIHTNRERNREHARATRQRRKVFKQIEEILSDIGYKY